MESVCALHNVEVVYCFQSIDNIPGELPKDRTKPWGTGQAVLTAKELIDTPFAVINADDYYGKEAFVKLHDYLVVERADNDFCMAGFILKNTLSENGGVTRGVCDVDQDGYLIDVNETSDIIKTANGASVKGVEIDPESYVSMNMWGLSTKFMNILEDNFKVFFEKTVPTNPLKAEYLLPILIGELLQDKKVSVKVLETKDKWFGVTYAEDKEFVVESFEKLIQAGVYKEDLYSDL